MSTGIGVIIYTLMVMWFSGDKLDIEAKDQAVVVNGCETERDVELNFDDKGR